ncbi:hypothetical protein Kisp01_26410 [Kineosporia sp. NBRC 101677]|nr:hypothetical protein Kisp01_26410 [Kineosporia sp. NBRC 101677]
MRVLGDGMRERAIDAVRGVGYIEAGLAQGVAAFLMLPLLWRPGVSVRWAALQQERARGLLRLADPVAGEGRAGPVHEVPQAQLVSRSGLGQGVGQPSGAGQKAGRDQEEDRAVARGMEAEPGRQLGQVDQAGRLGQAGQVGREGAAGRWRVAAWALVQAVVGTVLGIVGLLVVGNVVQAVMAASIWWLLSPADPARLFVEVPVRSWLVALTLAPLQVLLLLSLTLATAGPLARAYARWCLVVLAPSEADLRAGQLAERVAVLAETRADVLDAHAGELRRIERDLHDGTQAHLVAIAVRLGVAEKAQARGEHERVGELIGQAHQEARTAMESLRAVLRSVYPPILADRGLPGALKTLTAGCAVPTRLEMDEVGRLPAAVESVVYFVVAESLTNVARHSGAQAAGVEVRLHPSSGLRLTVTDDGAGAADARRGSGLNGMRDRVRALDGSFQIDSPAGGPTVIQVELPCGW